MNAKYNHLQHYEMFKKRMIKVLCLNKTSALLFIKYLDSLGYIWHSGSKLFDYSNESTNGKYYYWHSSFSRNQDNHFRLCFNDHGGPLEINEIVEFNSE